MEDQPEATVASHTARAVLEVVAGLLPGTPEPEFTRRWTITSAEWETANGEGKASQLLAERNGQAQGYAGLLMLQPDRLSWVRAEWLWL